MIKSSLFKVGAFVTFLLALAIWLLPLAGGLTVIFAASLLLFWLLRGANGTRVTPFSSFFWLACHAALTMLFCLHTIGTFVGWQEGGSPKIAVEEQRLIQYNGFYLGADTPNATLIAAGDEKNLPAKTATFAAPALQTGERIALNAVAKGAGVNWTVKANASVRPIRLDGWIVNPNAQWMAPDAGQGFSVAAKNGNRLTLTWLGRQNRGFWPLARERDIFRYAQNNCNGRGDCAVEVDLAPMREGQPLPQLLRRIVAAAPADSVKKFARLYLDDADIAGQIADMTVVRAWSGSGTAPRDPLQTAGRTPTGLGVLTLKSPAPSVCNVTATPRLTPVLSYGLSSEDETFALKLPGEPHLYALGGNQKLRAWPLLFGAPARWKIPAASDYLRAPATPDKRAGKSAPLREFLLTSSREYIPLPGYLLLGNGRAHEFFARGTLRAGLDSWSVTDGKMARQNEAAPRLGETVALGDKTQGALVSLQPARALYAFTGPRAAQRLLLALALYLLVIVLLWRPSRTEVSGDATAADAAWHLLWAGACCLVVVRLILAYRISLLPPPDVTPGELQNIFNDSLRQSLWPIFWVPAAVVIARLVALALEPETRLRAPIVALWSAPAALFLLANLARPDALWPALATLALASGAASALGKVKVQSRAIAKGEAREPSASRFAHWTSAPAAWIGAVWGGLTLGLVALQWVGRALPGSANSLVVVGFALALALCARIVFLLDRGQFSPHALLHAPPRALSSGFKVRRNASNRALGLSFVLALLSLIILGAAIDAGLMILFFPLLFALLFLLWAQRSEGKRWLIWVPPAGVTAAVALLWLLPRTPLATSTPISNENHALFYRLTVFSQRESDVLLDSDKFRSQPQMVLDNIRRNSQQQWQMLHYAQQGRHNSPGYGGAVLSQRSMTYDTAVSDCVFAVFLVGEHGAGGALAVLGLYLLVGGACLWGVAVTPEARSFRAIPLALVGAFFVCQALYMAAANLGLTVFTGQNLPLLSPRSGSDALQSLILLFLGALWLSWRASADAFEAPVGDIKTDSIAAPAAIFAVLALVGWLAIARQLRALPMPSSYNVDGAVLARLRDNPPDGPTDVAAGKPISWNWRGGDWRTGRAQLTVGGNVSLLERQYARAFNALSRSEQIASPHGVYYLADNGPQSEVRVNIDAFRVASPFSNANVWTGAVLARGPQAPQPTLSALGRTFSLSLNTRDSAVPIEVDFDAGSGVSTATQSQRGLSRVVLFPRGNNPNLVEIRRDPKTDALTVYPGAANGYGLWLNGKSLKNARTRGDQLRALQPFDILTIERERDGRRFNLISLGAQAPPLAFSQWRNGRAETFYRQSNVLPWSAAVLDAARTTKVREVNLSLDLPLHENLQRDLSYWALKQPDFRRSDQMASATNQRRLALSLLDAHSGEVLALPSWPLRDPSSPEFAAISDPNERARFLLNHNLSLHAVGSTIKPITFAAMSSQMWGSFDVSQIRVPRRSANLDAVYQSLGDISFDKTLTAQGDPMMTMSGAPDALADNFMVRSRNWPHLLLGALGTIQQPDDWRRVLRPAPASQADLFYGSQPYKLNLAGVSDGAISTGKTPRFVPSRATSALLFQGYRSIAEVAYSGNSADLNAFRARQTAQQWPTLAPQSPGAGATGAQKSAFVRRLNELDAVTSDAVNLNPEKISTVRGDFVSFLLGSGLNKWNNIALSETAARLATGQKVEATFQSRDGKTPDWAPLPAPWNAQGGAAKRWKARNFFAPLQAVAENPRGTAYSYLHGKTGRYVGLFKTGTVNEDNTPLNSETLMFVVGEFRGDIQNGGEFVPGRTVAGYLYMQKCNVNGQNDGIRRSTLFPAMLRDIVKFLDEREGRKAN